MSRFRWLTPLATALVVILVPCLAAGAEVDPNEPGILDPVSSALQGKEIRIPNTDQSVDGVEQSLIEGSVVRETASQTVSLLGHPISRVASPNDDLRTALQDLVGAAGDLDQAGMDAAAAELMAILKGTTTGRVYDGFAMLNFNRWNDPSIGPEFFPGDAMPGEYKMKLARDTGRTYTSPYDGEQRKIWEVDINMLYYDGQIDSDTFLVRFPFGHDWDDVLHVNYRIYSLVEEDFSPTLVALDRREAMDTVQFPYKGFDAVWVAMTPGEVINLTVMLPPVRQIRGIYDWGWRVHPPRIQFMQPIYEIQNQWTGEIQLDPQSLSFATRNREDLTLDTIADEAPEKKMYLIADAVLNGATFAQVEKWMTDPNLGPRGTWIEWADLVKNQTQLPPEAWDVLAEEDGLTPGDFGPYHMVSVYMNNEMYGEGPFRAEVLPWKQEDKFQVKLINFDKHTHYFRNVDFSARLHDDIGRCCGGGLTSFEIMNFKPSFGAPKVAEMQYRAGWGFRPHHDIIQQSEPFPRGRDRMGLVPYRGGLGGWFYGYLYSPESRGGDFRFNPPPFVITNTDDPAPFPLREFDGSDGLLMGQKTPGYGVAQLCPQDPYGDFCQTDFGPFNPHKVLNWPEPGNPDVTKTELRFPNFLRNPAQGDPQAGDIIPPTGAWRPFQWINPNNGTLYIDDQDHSKGYWADLTYSHGAPVMAGGTLVANIETPRSSGQLFYQFDDLFHDNSIFSPHPVATGSEGKELDVVDRLKARVRGNQFGIAGRLKPFVVTGEFARYVAIHRGPAGEKGCTGEILQIIATRPDGKFGVMLSDTGVGVGEAVCAQSVIGGFLGTTTSN